MAPSNARMGGLSLLICLGYLRPSSKLSVVALGVPSKKDSRNTLGKLMPLNYILQKTVVTVNFVAYKLPQYKEINALLFAVSNQFSVYSKILM